MAVRYKQIIVGAAWALIRPLLTMVVFTVIFGRLAKLPSEGDAPMRWMVYAGMLPWYLFSDILSEASNSLVGKIYFPRLIIPCALVVALVDFGISFVILAGLMLWSGFMPGWQALLLPLLASNLGPISVNESTSARLTMNVIHCKARNGAHGAPYTPHFSGSVKCRVRRAHQTIHIRSRVLNLSRDRS